MFKCTLLLGLVVMSLSRTYPMFKQCDSKWGNEQLGTSSNTICSAGCLMSSVAMALAGTGHNFNPSTLNQWLKEHGGYVNGDLLVWGSINSLGLTYQGKIANFQIKTILDQGKVVICNVRNGAHWVLAYDYSGNDILVNDPGYNVASYSMNQIVQGQNGVYTLTGTSSAYKNLIKKLKSVVNPSKAKNQWWNEADGGSLQIQLN